MFHFPEGWDQQLERLDALWRLNAKNKTMLPVFSLPHSRSPAPWRGSCQKIRIQFGGCVVGQSSISAGSFLRQQGWKRRYEWGRWIDTLCVGGCSESTHPSCFSPDYSFLLFSFLEAVPGALLWFYKPLCLLTSLSVPSPHIPHQNLCNCLGSLCRIPWHAFTEIFLSDWPEQI